MTRESRAETLADTLAKTVGPVFFSDLRTHIARDVIIVVDASLALLEVAVALADDDKPRVAAWVDGGLVRKPSIDELARWAEITDARWESVVVAPFVLVRELPPTD